MNNLQRKYWEAANNLDTINYLVKQEMLQHQHILDAVKVLGRSPESKIAYDKYAEIERSIENNLNQYEAEKALHAIEDTLIKWFATIMNTQAVKTGKQVDQRLYTHPKAKAKVIELALNLEVK